MPQLLSNRVKERVTDLSGGQNSGSEPSTLAMNQAELLENSIITKRGKAKQRGGLTRTGDNPDTLISIWGFDDSSAVDDKADNDGTASSVTYVAGKFGKAASFNGSSSYISFGTATDLSASNMGAFRLSAWIYVDSDGEGDQGRIFDKFSSSNVGYRLYVWGQSGTTVKLDFEVGHATTNTRVITSTTLTTGAWHKVDAIYNSDKSGDIYIDGAIATYSTDTSGVGAISTDTGNTLYLGNDSTFAYTFDGEIDDARIYDGSFTSEDVELKTILGITTYRVGSTIDTVIRAKDQAIQRLSSDYKSWTDITGLTTLTAGLTTNFVQANDRLFILNGTDNVFSIDSSLTVTDEANTNIDPPKTTFGEWATNNRLFLSGSLTTSQRDYVWFSDSLDPQTFDRSTNVFKVRSGSGGKVTWLKMFKDFELIVYKDDSIFVLDLNGTDPLTHWQLKPLSVAVGCPAGRTVADIGNDHIFLANDGVRLLSRTTFDKLRVGVISEPIQDIIDDINQDAVQNSVGFFENGLYILGVPTGTSTTPNRFMIWDSIAAQRNNDPNSAWTTIPNDTWNISCMTSYGYGDNLKVVVGGEARALTLCYKMLSGNTDNGTTIVQKIITREHDFGDPFVNKIFDPTQIVGTDLEDGSIYLLEIDVDRSGFSQVGTISSDGLLQTPFTTPTVTIAGTEHEDGNFRTKFAGRGSSVRLKITNSVYNTNPTFLEYTLYTRPFTGRI